MQSMRINKLCDDIHNFIVDKLLTTQTPYLYLYVALGCVDLTQLVIWLCFHHSACNSIDKMGEH